MFDDKNLQKDDALARRLERLSGQVKPSSALMKAAKTGVPLRSMGIRYTAGMHIRKFSKAVLIYAACVALFLGAILMLPRLFGENGPVASNPVSTTDTSIECNHKYVMLTMGLRPSCTEGTVLAYRCQYCGHSYSEQKPAPGHDFVDGICTRCGEKVMPPDPEDCEHDNDPATCPYCNCDEHVWISSENTATCTEGCKVVNTCIKCGYSHEEWQKPLGHDYVDFVCTRCGDLGDPDVPPPRTLCEHDSDLSTCPYCNCDGHEFADNTCTKCGLVCQHEYRIESSFFTHPCTGYKTERGVCLLCGHTYEKNIDNVGHNYVDGICTKCGTECTHNYTDDTCDAVCTLCGKLQGHDYEEIVSTDRICTEGTVTTTTCSRCGYSYTEITPAKGHSYENGSCTVCGEKKKTVTVTDPDVTAGSESLLPEQMYQTYPSLKGDGITWVDPTMTPYYYNVYTYFEGYTITDIRVPVYYAEKGSVFTIYVAKTQNGLITDRIASYQLTADRAIDREWVLFSGLSIEVPEGCTLTFGWMSDTLSYASPLSGHIPGYSRQDDYSGLGSQIPLIFDIYGKKS